MPGIGLVMDGAMQQAPQRGRQPAVRREVVFVGAGMASGMGGLSAQVARLGEGA
jgi:hypothetical protein